MNRKSMWKETVVGRGFVTILERTWTDFQSQAQDETGVPTAQTQSLLTLHMHNIWVTYLSNELFYSTGFLQRNNLQ